MENIWNEHEAWGPGYVEPKIPTKTASLCSTLELTRWFAGLEWTRNMLVITSNYLFQFNLWNEFFSLKMFVSFLLLLIQSLKPVQRNETAPRPKPGACSIYELQCFHHNYLVLFAIRKNILHIIYTIFSLIDEFP